jgi:MFS family permease
MLPIAILTMVATTPGQTHGVSVFNPYLREALNLSHSQLTGAYMIGTLMAAVPQPFIGRIMDRVGLRRTMTATVFMLGVACVLASQASSLFTLFLAFFFLRAFGQGALSLVAGNTLAMWFDKRLGAVSGVMNVGVAASIAMLPPMFLALIQLIGWRNAYIVLGAGVWILLFPIVILLYKNQPHDVNQTLDSKASMESAATNALRVEAASHDLSLASARRSRAYWLLIGATAAWSMIGTAIAFNIIPIFDSFGFSETNAAATFTVLAIASAATQIVAGVIADYIPLRWMASASLAMIALAVVTLMGLDSLAGSRLYATFYGIGQGLFGIVSATIWVRYYGRTHLGAIRGSVWMATVAASSTGPFLMGFTFDSLGSYQASFVIFLTILVLLAIAVLWATPPAPHEKDIAAQSRSQGSNF